MKRSSDTRGSTAMPSFLDEPQDQTEAALDAEVQEQDEEQFEAEAELDAEPPDEAEQDDLQDEPDESEVNDSVAARTAIRPARNRGRASVMKAKHAAGGTLSTVFGLALAIGGAVATQLPELVRQLGTRNLDPQLLALFGVVLLVIGRGQRSSAALQSRLDSLEDGRSDAEVQLRDTLANLQDRQPSANPEAGEIEHVRLSLQRQDQKINNLTKAIKMYGKPLLDISSQGTDLAGNVAQVRTLVEAGSESTRTAMQRLEEQIRKASKQTDLGELPEQVKQLGVSLAAVTQRLEDSEVRKSLVRLEDFAKELRQEVHVLQRGETAQAAAETVLGRLEEARKGLAAGILQLRDGNLGGLENSVRELLREVASLATSTAQIQAAVKSGARVATATAPPATTSPSAPPPVTPKATVHSATSAALPANEASDDSGAAGYQTGKRSSTGRNVLGAIAKLKQMKG